jgi:hypothetical protein
MCSREIIIIIINIYKYKYRNSVNVELEMICHTGDHWGHGYCK